MIFLISKGSFKLAPKLRSHFEKQSMRFENQCPESYFWGLSSYTGIGLVVLVTSAWKLLIRFHEAEQRQERERCSIQCSWTGPG